MLEAIAKAVRDARTRQHLSPSALALRAGLAADRVAAIEAARRGVSLAELDRVADALELDRDALAMGHVVERPRASTFFRQSAWQDYHAEDSALLDRVMDQARDLRAIDALLGPRKRSLRARFTPEPVRGEIPAEAAREGHEKAIAVRAALRIPAAPLPELASLLEGRFDLTVWVLALRTRVPALSLLDGDRGAATIVLNANDRARQENPLLDRVHLAHELCHLLFDETEPGRLHLVFEVEGDEGLAESRARGFAAEFLMPREGLVALFGKVRATRSEAVAVERVQKARAHFGTPWQIAAWQLGNQGFVQKELAGELATRAYGETPKGFRTVLPAPGMNPARLASTVHRAWSAERITDGEARKALGLPLGAPLPFEA